MLIQFQIIQTEEEGYKIVFRIDTSNDLGITHTKVVSLKENAFDSFFRLALPVGVDFEDIQAVATESVIESVKEQEAAKAAEAAAEESSKSDEEVESVQSDIVAAPEAV